jgi:hypothetical protein
MAKPKRSLAERLLAAQVAIDNAMTDEEVKTLIAAFGYDETRMNTGKALLNTVNQLQQTQQKEYGDQFQATDALNGLLMQADAEYMRFIKISRVALKSEHALVQKLALNGRRKKSFSGWIAQAKQFYLNALSDPAVIEKLGGYGMTQEKLEAGKALLEQTETANATQKKEKGEAQQATLDRDKALDELEEWLGDFIAITRIALEDKPQLLEKLGIVEPS